MTANLATAFAFVVAMGCGANEGTYAASRFAIEFHINNDDGDAVKSAAVRTGGKDLGVTGAEGMLKVELTGTEGQTVPVTVTCPHGCAGTEKPSLLRLSHTRRIDFNGYQATRFEATCTREVRDIVLVVRAQGGARLAVNVDGTPSGATNADGIAHVLVHADRQMKALKVSLDTSSRPELKPKNPSRTYELAGNDAILLFDQTFVSTPKRAFRAAPPKPSRHIPYRVD